MSALVINNVNVDFVIENGAIFCDSLHIARVFDKNHPEVLRLIRKLPTDEFKTSNFKESHYFNSQNKRQPAYKLTRDGFALLAMGFTGERAYHWKVEYIKAFNLMEARLKQNQLNELSQRLAVQDKHHKNQINGYKSQISQHNAVILRQKSEIEAIKAQIQTLKNQPQNDDSTITSLKAIAHNYKLDMKFYYNKCKELELKLAKLENQKQSGEIKISEHLSLKLDDELLYGFIEFLNEFSAKPEYFNTLNAKGWFLEHLKALGNRNVWRVIAQGQLNKEQKG